MSGLIVPDATEPILAARQWNVKRGWRVWCLESLNEAWKWPRSRPLEAHCALPMRRMMMFSLTTGTNEKEPEHGPVPKADCSCGVWALADPLDFQVDRNPEHPGLVAGVVQLWGRVVVGEFGWRAQYAKPVSLVPWGEPTSVEQNVSLTYGLPIEDEWPKLTRIEEVERWTSGTPERPSSSSL